ncbi:MAG: hypothetical protein ACRDH7_05830 [Actinomycetota bacterium]
MTHRRRGADGSVGDVRPLEGSCFGPVAVGPWTNGVLEGALADGVVTSQAWAVRIAFKDGTQLQAHLARVPEDIAPGLSAFIAFLPDSSEPVAVIAEDESGTQLGSQGLGPPR